MKNLFFLSLFLLVFITSKSHAENICFSTSSTADNGTLYDSGGSSGYYSNYDNCGFLIQPALSPASITLSFSQFSVENGWDYLYVYDGTNSSGTLLGTFTGYSLPTDVTATSSSMYLRFVSDYIYRYQGFSASWTSSTVPVQAELKASYNFDDDWDTNNTLTDQTGTYNGTPSGSISRVSAGASGSKGDTCYAASFSGGEIDITNLPVSTSTGAKTSISFWMYWDGTKNVMPMGWYQHDLFFGANNSGAGSTIYFGFNTWGWDVTGITASGLDNGWHHVAAVFTNGSVANNKLYIDGVEQSISHRTGTINNSNATVQTTLRLGAATASSSWPFSGILDNFKVYTGTITQAQVTTDMNESNACSGGGGDTAATAFNCVENGSDGITGKLYTKTNTQTFSFDIVALQDASTIETNFASGADHTVTVELVDTSSGNCSTYPSLNPVVSQNIVFIASDSGTKTSALMSSATAYSNVKCRVTDATNSPSVIGCSTDTFAIRPTIFSITSNLTNGGSTGTPTAKTGENFTLSATATTGYSGTPKIDSSKVEAHSGAVQTGNISGSFNSANSSSGVATGSAFTYSEVGSLRFAAQGIYDDAFTVIDQSSDCTDDFSNTPVGGKIGCKFGNASASNYYGRFTPDHFVLSNTNLTNRSNLSCSPASSYTYTGEEFLTSFRLTANNSSNNTTQNYTGNFSKLDSSIMSNFGFGAIDLTSATTLTSKLSLISSSGSWSNGIADFTATMELIRTTPEEPFESFQLGIAPVDSDGISLSSYNLDTSVPADSNDRELVAATKIRFGRLSISNVHGSELLPLTVPLTTEYYNGSEFVKNNDDSCSDFNLANDFSISDPADLDCSLATNTSPFSIGSTGQVKAVMANTTVSNGTTEITISDDTDVTKGPGAGNTGYIEITSNLLTNFPWLRFDWDADSVHDNCPSTRATFGIFKGNSKQIYFREVY